MRFKLTAKVDTETTVTTEQLREFFDRRARRGRREKRENKLRFLNDGTAQQFQAIRAL
jgi:hypothetical protein